MPLLLSPERQEKGRAQVSTFSFSTVKPQNGSIPPAKWHITKEEGTILIGETVWFSFSGISLLFRDPLVVTHNPPTNYKILQWNVSELLCHCLNAQSNIYEIHQGKQGEKKKEDFFWCIMKKKCFLLKSCKRKKRSLWNTLQQFGTHIEQFHFRAFSKLFQWMLANKGNLHWKFLQEHRPFHVSQQGSLAFIPGLLLFLSLFLCPQSILSGSYSSACPQCLSPIQHQNPHRNVSVATISLPILVPT